MITKKEELEFKKPKLFKIWNFLIYGSTIAIGVFLVYLYSTYIFINKWRICIQLQLPMECWIFYCLVGLLTLLLEWNANLIFMSSWIKDFLDKIFDLYSISPWNSVLKDDWSFKRIRRFCIRRMGNYQINKDIRLKVLYYLRLNNKRRYPLWLTHQLEHRSLQTLHYILLRASHHNPLI